MTPQEPDFPPGHPKRFDYDPASPEAREWARQHYAPKGDRDFPVGHPKAVDTPGNTNTVAVRAGVDPDHPELEPFTGRTPEQVSAHKELQEQLAREAKESPVRDPVEAPPPPQPLEMAEPTGQPGS